MREGTNLDKLTWREVDRRPGVWVLRCPLQDEERPDDKLKYGRRRRKGSVRCQVERRDAAAHVGLVKCERMVDRQWESLVGLQSIAHRQFISRAEAEKRISSPRPLVEWTEPRRRWLVRLVETQPTSERPFQPRGNRSCRRQGSRLS